MESKSLPGPWKCPDCSVDTFESAVRISNSEKNAGRPYVTCQNPECTNPKSLGQGGWGRFICFTDVPQEEKKPLKKRKNLHGSAITSRPQTNAFEELQGSLVSLEKVMDERITEIYKVICAIEESLNKLSSNATHSNAL